MFSTSVELILSIAYREAVSRRHAHLTLEHVLLVLAHDPEGEAILEAAGADLPQLRTQLTDYLATRVETVPEGSDAVPEQTRAFTRVLSTAVMHAQSSAKEEVTEGDLLAALLIETTSAAARELDAQGVTRLDVLNYLSHGVRKSGTATGEDAAGEDDDEDADIAEILRAVDAGDEAPATARPATGRKRGRSALALYATSFSEAARAGSSIRSSAAPPNCGAPSKYCAGVARTTQSSSANPASVRPRWRKASRRGCSASTLRCRVHWRAPRSSRSIPRHCSRERGIAAISKSG